MSLHIETENSRLNLLSFALKRLLTGAILLSFVVSCTDKASKEQFLDGKYEGFWAEIMWTYELKHNGQFTFTSRGHFGNVVESGFYLMKNSLVLLNPRSDGYINAGVKLNDHIQSSFVILNLLILLGAIQNIALNCTK